MIYEPVDKYLKEKKILNQKYFRSLHLILILCRQPTGGRYCDVGDDEVEWDIIYVWLEEAVPV